MRAVSFRNLLAQQNPGVPKRILSPTDKDVDSERPSEAGRLLPRLPMGELAGPEPAERSDDRRGQECTRAKSESRLN